MEILALIISIPILTGYIALLIAIGYYKRHEMSSYLLWLITLHIVGAVMAAGSLITAFMGAGFGADFSAVLRLLTAAVYIAIFGSLMLRDINPQPLPFKRAAQSTPNENTSIDRFRPHWLRLWGIAMVIWLVALVGALMLGGGTNLGKTDWAVVYGVDIAAIVGIIGFVFAAIGLLAAVFHAFYIARLPELANRALFWVMLIGGLVMALILEFSGTLLFSLLGDFTLVVTTGGIVYAFVNYQVINMRAGLRKTLVTVVVTAVSTALLLTALYAMTGLDVQANIEGVLVLSLIALGIAVIYIPVRQFIESIFNFAFQRTPFDAAQVTREFSKRVYQATNLKEVVNAATDSVNVLMGIERSGIMLVNSSFNGSVELLAMEGGIFDSETKGVTFPIALDSPVYYTLAKLQQPLTQFELEYAPRYAKTPVEQVRFLNKLEMSAYAPVIMDAVFVGLLMVGAKPGDRAFTPEDLMVLSTMAQQTGFAIRNSRLVADLKHLNDSMRSLNKGLEEANRELERLDSVKSDFVTIASHELRTPLAQIRGYSDMIDSMNESGLLEQDQVAGMVLNLRKASERMEELIAAMLDVSQIDVDAMDLRFTKTTPETVLRMAIEPLTNEIKQRKLNFTARWKGLPPIQADLQRLVQAFRNIVVNAIKFTPDGGTIELVASLQPAKRNEDVDHILVTISDTGVGIDEDNLDLVFKKFFRTYDPALHSTGAYKFLGAGPGLGLTIAKGVIEAHGGRIWAESPGHSMTDFPGTTFYVLLPVSPTDDSKRSLTFESEAKPPADKSRLDDAHKKRQSAQIDAASKDGTQEMKTVKPDEGGNA